MLSRVNGFSRLSSFMTSSKKKNATTALASAPIAIPSPIKFRSDKEGFVQLTLHVKPGAKVSRVAEITESYIGLQISAPPRDGEANEEVIRYLAEIFKVKERQVSLISGQKSRDKIVLIENEVKSAEDVHKILINNQN